MGLVIVLVGLPDQALAQVILAQALVDLAEVDLAEVAPPEVGKSPYRDSFLSPHSCMSVGIYLSKFSNVLQ